MARYFRTYNESKTGEVGFFYFEVIDQMLTRMVDEFNGQLFWSTPGECKNEGYEFTDQPEFDEADISDLIDNMALIELSESEFDMIWQRSKQ